MKNTAEYLQYLVALLNHKVTFVAYSLPGDSSLNFIIDDNHSPFISNKRFVISKWNGIKINIFDRAVSSLRLNNAEPNTIDITHCSETSWIDYKSAINDVTSLLNDKQGKVVLSRIKLLTNPRLEYQLIAQSIFKMFKAYQNTFRAVYYTPETGAWCVCSPELLLNIDKPARQLRTIALAGTRHGDCSGKWDDKNTREHSYVVQYIADTLSSLGISPHIGPMETMVTGNIQHILTRISGNIKIDDISIEKIVDALHPTPAICGYPIAWSKRIINDVEHHDRECYGGYIAIDDDDSFLAHVNLRCFAFSPGLCRFWGGGGILADSCAENEWEEADLKINASLSFLLNELM